MDDLLRQHMKCRGFALEPRESGLILFLQLRHEHVPDLYDGVLVTELGAKVMYIFSDPG